jgi:hypothetical protein
MGDFLILCSQRVESCPNSILEVQMPDRIRGLPNRKN